jgi:hypothetical protein
MRVAAMIPVAKPAPTPVAPLPQQRIVFRIFQDARGRWCARSDDGMTGGTFFAREAALRFVGRETVGLSALVLLVAPDKAR